MVPGRGETVRCRRRTSAVEGALGVRLRSLAMMYCLTFSEHRVDGPWESSRCGDTEDVLAPPPGAEGLWHLHLYHSGNATQEPMMPHIFGPYLGCSSVERFFRAAVPRKHVVLLCPAAGEAERQWGLVGSAAAAPLLSRSVGR